MPASTPLPTSPPTPGGCIHTYSNRACIILRFLGTSYTHTHTHTHTHTVKSEDKHFKAHRKAKLDHVLQRRISHNIILLYSHSLQDLYSHSIVLPERASLATTTTTAAALRGPRQDAKACHAPRRHPERLAGSRPGYAVTSRGDTNWR
ncbi:hypothetical protein E2C01_070845 [Portunus trituberculatus]|uniref:Uncharacterized protein n=1 Tax=Portunus trituberculatus TaxID=210409 RepID=A0A5B7I2Q9_PORTR|nr:hypothetical protein [Portunus trituberculatus]